MQGFCETKPYQWMRAIFAMWGIVRDDAFHTIRIGLNYHFLPVNEPLK
jgi:hypothetical protein